MLAGRTAGSAGLPWWGEHGGGVSAGGTPGDPGRRLVLLRHGKSDWPDVADHERPLARRGRRDAPVVGRWLAASGYVPDVVVCSTALRARETWALAEGGLLAAGLLADGPGAPPAVRYDSRVYEATVLGLLMLIREFEPRWRTAMIVGHNPGLAELTVGLAGPHLEPPSAFPTAAVAVLRLPGAWAEAAPGEARLLAFAVPADMRP
jgi:phosphohistidine phosphatase